MHLQKILQKQWPHKGVPPANKHEPLLKKGVRLLHPLESQLTPNSKQLSEQPFDLHLLQLSSLYQRSRKKFLAQKGTFLPTHVSSSRGLSSPILLENQIAYSPIASELIWRATEPKCSLPLLSLCDSTTSVFHEQNHRILWKLLPPCPPNRLALQRYLNFAESLVVAVDMALSDFLGPEIAALFYLSGAIYDPGTTVRQELPSARDYRNYLQATSHATYLNLEGYDPADIQKVITHLFPNLGPFAKRAAIRSSRLDPTFIQKTNRLWQKRHHKLLTARFCHKDRNQLAISSSPIDNRVQYLFAEQWFEQMGL